jgi:hypothetical protein
MPYRFKATGPYAEFIVRQRGPGDNPDLSIELDSTYDERFVGLLKSNLRYKTERHWYSEAKRWYIAPAAFEKAVEAAKACYRNVFKTDGDQVIDLVTGEEIPQTMNLFA